MKINIKTKKAFKMASLVLIAVFVFYPVLETGYADSLYEGGDGEEEQIKTLSDEIKIKQEKIKELSEKINDYNDEIKHYQTQSVTLNSQINYLDARIKKTEAEIELTQNQIEENALQIQDTENKIRQHESDIKAKKERLRDLIQEVYQNDQESELEILLGHESVSDFYNNLRAISILQNKTNDSLKDLKFAKEELEKMMTELEAKKISLRNLKDKLLKNRESLAEQIITKQNILSQTRNSEYRFQSLLSQVKSEQANINAEIASLEQQIRERLSGGDVDKLKALGDANFIWPVPNRGITAYFHDPTYPFRYIFEHPAIDIRSAQGSPVRAAASGYVGRVKISGTAYGYIMIIHADGFSTVYGHATKSYVSEDQFVTQGEIIGLSGGMPGTTGAGRLSTGPHLHFEIRKNGIPVNPLNYLP